MRKSVFAGVILSTFCWAQNDLKLPTDERPHYFKLEFQVKELESGKVVNSRDQSIIISSSKTSQWNGTVRTGSRVPYMIPGGNYQFAEVGINVDCRIVRELDNQLDLNISTEISVASTEPNSPAPPVIRQTKWNSDVTVPLKKPTVVFSSDDPASSKRTIQFEVTATPIK